MSGLSFFIITSLLFFVGAAVGSFLNVLIERSIEGANWVTDRSRCDVCGHKLAWYDNIPLLSFLILKGRCRYCGAKISHSHILMEVLTGTLFVWWFLGGFVVLNIFKLTQHPFVIIQPLFWLLAAILLLLILIYDLKYLFIPDATVWSLFILVLVYRLALVAGGVMRLEDLIWSLTVSAFAAALLSLLWFVTLGKGIGLGDVKLVIPLSLLVGWQLTTVGLFLAFLVGAGVSLLLLVLGKVRFGKPIPFGPYLILGFSLALVIGRPVLDWYLSMI